MWTGKSDQSATSALPSVCSYCNHTVRTSLSGYAEHVHCVELKWYEVETEAYSAIQLYFHLLVMCLQLQLTFFSMVIGLVSQTSSISLSELISTSPSHSVLMCLELSPWGWGRRWRQMSISIGMGGTCPLLCCMWDRCLWCNLWLLRHRQMSHTMELGLHYAYCGNDRGYPLHLWLAQ